MLLYNWDLNLPLPRIRKVEIWHWRSKKDVEAAMTSQVCDQIVQIEAETVISFYINPETGCLILILKNYVQI